MLVFLDIDGVLVTGGAWKKPELLNDGFAKFNANAAINLNKILSETNAGIILVTSHRFTYSIDEWKRIFEVRGVLVGELQLLKAKPSVKPSRADEILSWISEHRITSAYVIIDDDLSLNGLPPLIKSRCIVTRTLIGLDNESAAKAIHILKKN